MSGHARRGWIVYSGFDWWRHSHAHVDFQLAKRLARTEPVLFVNSIGLRVPTPGRTSHFTRRVVRKLRALARRSARPSTDLDLLVCSPVSLPVLVPGRLRDLSSSAVRAQVRRHARRMGMEDPVAIVCLPSFAPALEADAAVVYYRYDLHSGFREADGAAVAALEHQLLDRSDLVVYASSVLMDDEAGRTRGRALLLEHGIDDDLFGAGPWPEPADIAAVPKPRIGFVGLLRDHSVDVSLLERTARDLPDASLVLVGGIQADVSALEALPNVHPLGERAHAEIPAFVAALDVGLIPLQETEFTRYQSPIKLREYLAQGLPVVSTDLPEAVRQVPLVRVAGTADEFVAAVRAALADTDPADRERRVAAGRSITWDGQAERFRHEVRERLG